MFAKEKGELDFGFSADAGASLTWSLFGFVLADAPNPEKDGAALLAADAKEKGAGDAGFASAVPS